MSGVLKYVNLIIHPPHLPQERRIRILNGHNSLRIQPDPDPQHLIYYLIEYCVEEWILLGWSPSIGCQYRMSIFSGLTASSLWVPSSRWEPYGRRQKRRQRSSLLFGRRTWMQPFSSKDDMKQFFGRTSILGGGGFGVVWTRWSSTFLKHPFCQASVLLLILFFKSSWC